MLLYSKPPSRIVNNIVIIIILGIGYYNRHRLVGIIYFRAKSYTRIFDCTSLHRMTMSWMPPSAQEIREAEKQRTFCNDSKWSFLIPWREVLARTFGLPLCRRHRNAVILSFHKYEKARDCMVN